MGTTTSAGLACALLAISSVAQAQEAPPPEETTGEDTENADNEDIVILAQPGDQVRIDRRTYTVRNDPVAQSTSMFEILGRIPSVSVAPSGEITLLGAADVTIQINGTPVPGANLEQVLRGLPGGAVERIEVITNPSAQYSAQTSGGIINIITRNRFERGLNGTLQASADSLGGAHAGLAPSWAGERWSFSGQAGFYGGAGDSSFTRERTALPAGALTSETGLRNYEYEGWYASRLQASYRPNERRRISASLDAGSFSFSQDQASLLAEAALSSLRNTLIDNQGDNTQLTFDLQQDGEQPREAVKFNAVLSQFVNTSDTFYTSLPEGGALAQYATVADQQTDGMFVKLDIEEPGREERFLTFGLSFDHSDQRIENALAPIAGASPPAYDARLDGLAQTLAAYATYQFETGDWTWLPGVRAENYRREVVSDGRESDDADLRVFPSLHIRRALTPAINVDLSYTSRIRRPGFSQLDPALRFFDIDRAFSGNPALAPTTTDAYEANFVYQKRGASFSVTAFDRISDDIVSQFTEVTADGVTLSMPVNAGTSEQRGLQAILRGPLGAHWRYSLSGNVQERAFDFLNEGTLSRRNELEYNGVAQIDYSDTAQDAAGADQLQFEVRFQGPRFGLQSESDEFVLAHVTWRRRLTRRLVGVLAVQDIFDSSSQTSLVTTDDYIERSEFSGSGTSVRLSLTLEFGDGPRPASQDQAAPPVPMQ